MVPEFSATCGSEVPQRDSYFIADQPDPAPHLAHPDGCAALRIMLVAVPRVSRSCYTPDLSQHPCADIASEGVVTSTKNQRMGSFHSRLKRCVILKVGLFIKDPRGLSVQAFLERSRKSGSFLFETGSKLKMQHFKYARF